MADPIEKEINTDISKLKVPDLKKELKSRGLSTSGNKSELMERLQAALKMNDTIGADSVDDLDEDLLNDEDDEHDEHIGSAESVMSDIDRALEDNGTQAAQQPKKRKLSDRSEENSESQNEDKPAPPKKIILNRKTPSFDQSPKPPTPTEAVKQDEPEKQEKKVIKLSELSAKERLEMRAKKFGVSVSDEAKKFARIERFTGSNNSTTSSTMKSAEVSVDSLKKRAERFGCNVSSVMTKLENQEKLEKRKERFGAAGSTNANGLSDSEKAQKRLERFKEPVK